jgi:hypothetical protein
VATYAANVAQFRARAASCTGSVCIGGTEHRSSVGDSERTVTGTASAVGRESWKEAPLFDTAMNRRVDSIAAGWNFLEVLEVPNVAVFAGGTI